MVYLAALDDFFAPAFFFTLFLADFVVDFFAAFLVVFFAAIASSPQPSG
jgi:hypothetical protein